MAHPIFQRDSLVVGLDSSERMIGPRLFEAHGRKWAPIFLRGPNPIPLMEQKFFCRNRVENGANLSSEEKELLTFTYKTLPAVTFLTMWIPNITFSPDLLQSEIATLQMSEGGDLQFDPFKPGIFCQVDKKCEIAAMAAALAHSIAILAHRMD